MFHRDCYQILLLNFRSSTETINREDSQIDRSILPPKRFLHLGGGRGGVRQQRFSNLDNNQFFKQRN